VSGEKLDELLRDAIAAEVVPGCSALVWRDGELRYRGAHGWLARHGLAPEQRRAVSSSTRYDLASLTKVIATTTLVAQAVGLGQLSLDDPLPASLAIGPQSEPLEPQAMHIALGLATERDGTYRPTLRDLLEHASGLAAHREFFHEPWSLAVGARDQLIAAVRNVPLAASPRTQAIYSDLGFLLLGAWLEQLGSARLDELFQARVARPLGLERELGFPALTPLPTEQVAATEVYDASLHRGARPHWFAIREQADQTTACGLVHDDNCLVMGGVAGHAGLFGTATSVLTIARAWLEHRLPLLDADTNRRIVAQFTTQSRVPDSTRRLGFDGPSPDGSGATGQALSALAYGHLGFTGTSVWIDPPTRAIYILLSNRVHPTRNDDRIRTLRREFHALASQT
jgi:CubicO group peptidase (beta-lactamase class C family)